MVSRIGASDALLLLAGVPCAGRPPTADSRCGRTGRPFTSVRPAQGTRGIEFLTSRCFAPSIDCVRTTLSLDEDVAAKLQEETQRRRMSFKAVVNDCLRRGLEAPSSSELAAPFSIEPRQMGLRAGLDLDDIGGLLDFLDGPVRR